MSNTSMTAPKDRTSDRPDLKPAAPPLNDVEAQQAKQALVHHYKFPQVERRFVDPELPFQKIGLVSFVPAKGANPDADGFYGFLKLRGNYISVEDADDRADFLIRNADSYHDILHTRVGVPFPLVGDKDLITKFSEEENVIDITQKVDKEMAEEVKTKRETEKKEMKTLQEREQEMLKQNKEIIENDGMPETNDPDEAYTMMRSKRAQLIWTYLHQMKRLHNEVIPAIVKTSQDVRRIDQEKPELREECFRRFKAARAEVGIPDNDLQSGFVHYIIDDISEQDLKDAFFGKDLPTYKLLQEAIVS